MNNKAGNTFRDFLEISKLKIMLPVALTGFTGYFLFDPRLTSELAFVTAGILLLSVSASILNQLQEVRTDKLMARTRNRPLPSGSMDRSKALSFCLLSLVAGLVFMAATGSMAALLTSLFTIAWYNGVYTYLKRVTPYAVIPGALTGALPPLIGWTAAGGPFPAGTIVLVMLLFFIGQIPHFWLFILKYGGEYEAAGLPSLTSVVTGRTISSMIVILVMATAFAAGSLPFFVVIRNRLAAAVLLAASVILVTGFIRLPAKKRPGKTVTAYSMMLDIYFLLVIILLIYDRIMGGG